MNSEEHLEIENSLLSLDEPDQVLQAIQSLGVSEPSEQITGLERAGEGNMNLVMRVTTNRRSVIVKQARPWVEKYPTIAAPAERILAETEFYSRVAKVPELAQMMPKVIAKDEEQMLLVLDDLGAARDYISLYSNAEDQKSCRDVFQSAARWLLNLHNLADAAGDTGCFELRELNHAHMFSIPLSNPPAIDLDSVCGGLEQASRELREDPQMHRATESLGKIYLNPSGQKALLHGDYYPGSWLKTERGFHVIDPEFSFSGPREFDWGVMLAHYIFCHGSTKKETLSAEFQLDKNDLSIPLVFGFAGIELIRRLVGVAQLPLDADLELRTKWLSLGRDFVLEFAKS